jgi:hypothetical protein
MPLRSANSAMVVTSPDSSIRFHRKARASAVINVLSMITPSPRFIAYKQGSTARQGPSWLGLKARRLTTEAYATSRGADVIGRVTKVESGKNPDRPELGRALHLAQLFLGVTALIAVASRFLGLATCWIPHRHQVSLRRCPFVV